VNKKLISLILFVSLFCTAGLVLADGTITPPPGVPTDFSTLISNIVSEVGAVIVSIGTIMIVIAGLMFATSNGNPEKLNKAKTAFSYALIGIGIGVAASGIAELVKSWIT
jgi:hypothetical protein